MDKELATADNMSLYITIVIIVINEVLNIVTESLVRWIRFATKAEEMSLVVKIVFITQFFNTAIIIMIVNFNFSEHSPQAIWGLFNGRYTDYSPLWFKYVGD